MRTVFVAASLSVALVSLAYAYDIVHPNLKDAYAAADQAIHHIERAQQANQGVEFGGHAAIAIDHLKKAQAELIEADKYNEAHRKK